MNKKVQAILSALEAKKMEYRQKSEAARAAGRFAAAETYDTCASVIAEAIDLSRKACQEK